MQTNTQETNQYKPKVFYVKFNQCIENKIPDEVIDVVQQMPYNQFSIPVYIHVHTSKDKSKYGKVVQVGYIKYYDESSKTFAVAIFNNSKKLVKENPEIVVEYGEFQGQFTKVNRLVLV